MKKRCVLLIFLLVLTLPGCTPELPGTTAAKPVIYLYPQEETEGTVHLSYDGQLTCTYPAYKDGWTVTAAPDGTLTDGDGRAYYCLFWEGISSQDWDLSRGVCVRGGDTGAFLEEALDQLCPHCRQEAEAGRCPVCGRAAGQTDHGTNPAFDWARVTALKEETET